MNRSLLFVLALVTPGCVAPADEAPIDSRQDGIVYGTDDREEVGNHSDMLLREYADSVALVTNAATVQAINPTSGAVTLDETDLTDLFDTNWGDPVCQGEAFRDQETAGDCTAWLIAPDRLVTAAHCFYKDPNNSAGNPTTLASVCQDHRYVFDFELEPGNQRADISADDVYSCSSVLEYHYVAGEVDFAVVQLDRVTDRPPLPVDESATVAVNDAVTVIGHPNGLLKKITDGGTVRTTSYGWGFDATIDTFGGNSGSPVFSDTTDKVVGILVRGHTDWNYNSTDGCYEVNTVGDDPQGQPLIEEVVGIDQIGNWRDVGEPNHTLYDAAERPAHLTAQQQGTADYLSLGLRDGYLDRNHRAVSWPGDLDYIAIPVIHGDAVTVSIDFDSTVGDLDLELVDYGGQRLAISQFGVGTNTETVSFSLTGGNSGFGSQVVYAKVYGYSNATAPYSLDIDVVAADIDVDADGHADDRRSCGGTEAVTCGFVGGQSMECAPRANRVFALEDGDALDLNREAGFCEPTNWAHRVYAEIATSHPYANNAAATFDVNLPAGATTASLYSTTFSTEANYDFFVLSDGSKHSGNLGATTLSDTPVTGTAANGLHRPTLDLGFTSDGSITDYGVYFWGLDFY